MSSQMVVATMQVEEGLLVRKQYLMLCNETEKSLNILEIVFSLLKKLSINSSSLRFKSLQSSDIYTNIHLSIELCFTANERSDMRLSKVKNIKLQKESQL